MKTVFFSVCMAFVAWFFLFSPWTAGLTNFWTTITICSLVLSALALKFGNFKKTDFQVNYKEIMLGIVMALSFWCVFWVGDKMASFLFGFAREQVDSIYSLQGNDSAVTIAMMLFFIIGPGEELFWRAFVQRKMMSRWGKNVGFVVATSLYTLEHIWSFNFMLIMSALVIGGIWGLFYRYFPKHLTALIVSHAVWDTLVFVVFPI